MKASVDFYQYDILLSKHAGRLRPIHIVRFFLIATAILLVTSNGYTGVNGSVHTMRLRQLHQLLSGPLSKNKSQSQSEKNAQCESAFNDKFVGGQYGDFISDVIKTSIIGKATMSFLVKFLSLPDSMAGMFFVCAMDT